MEPIAHGRTLGNIRFLSCANILNSQLLHTQLTLVTGVDLLSFTISTQHVVDTGFAPLHVVIRTQNHPPPGALLQVLRHPVFLEGVSKAVMGRKQMTNQLQQFDRRAEHAPRLSTLCLTCLRTITRAAVSVGYPGQTHLTGVLTLDV